ncbi:methyltransferase, TIGR04325 family [Jannaschia sp. 2305UL9-9]|uniref:methyltransferase, TIGR04325 family n=1 Tax=Jannaschia sp. 2305UL9-9 TaxID=3121638 RepID=UPI0035286E65
MKALLKHGLTSLRNKGTVANTRLRMALGRSPRFVGAYPTRAEAAAALPPTDTRGYDDPAVSDVSFPQMCQRETWDYPVIHWLSRMTEPGSRVLDAGGHMGTKYIAFADLLDLSQVRWTVYDMPSIVAAARRRQGDGSVPADLSFVDTLDALPPSDVLLASGLLQYLDISLADLIAHLPERPDQILLNKVALRHGPTVHTLERIGSLRVPYQIRSWTTWEETLASLGYEVLDRWQIADLGHVIPTHPGLGRSESWGFALRRAT